MGRRISIFAAAAASACASAARAQCLDLQDGFEAYADGSGVAGQGAWTLWCDGGADAFVSGELAHGGARSLRIASQDDASSHLWLDFGRDTPQLGTSGVLQVWTYIPSGTGGAGAMEGVVSLLTRECNDASGPERLTETRFSLNEGLVRAIDGRTLPLVLDRWVLYEVGYSAGLGVSAWETYDGEDLSSASNDMAEVIRGAEIRADGVSAMHLDDVRVAELSDCPPDINCSNAIDLRDFRDFREYYVAGDLLRADFDRDGRLTLSDFVQFRNAYNGDCP